MKEGAAFCSHCGKQVVQLSDFAQEEVSMPPVQQPAENRQPEPAAAVPVQNVQPEPASAVPVQNVQPEAAAAQPVQNVQPKPAAAQPVQNVQPKPAAAVPVQNVQPKPAAAQPAQNVQPKPAAAQPAQNVQPKPAAAQPAQNVQPQPQPQQQSQPQIPSRAVVPVGNAYSNASGFAQQNDRASGQQAYGQPAQDGMHFNEQSTDQDGVKGLLSWENAERFAPLTAFMPLIQPVVGFILSLIFVTILGRVPVVSVIGKILVTICKFLFVVTPLAATGALVYIIVKKKDVSNILSWITPIVTFVAFLACLFHLIHKVRFLAWILGIPAVVFGFEFLSRICMRGLPIESAPDFPGMFRTFGAFIRDYRQKHPTTKDLERAGIEDPERSSFDGTGLQLLGHSLLASIVILCTCGIAAPWMICRIYRWRTDHTVINGKRLRFTGTGASLLGHWILWEILTAITCGIYGYFLYIAMKKWLLSHTYIEGESVAVIDGKGLNASYFDGTGLQFMGYQILSFFMLLFTLGLAYPWVMAMMTRWETKHEVVNRRRLVFSGTGLGFLGEYLIIALLTFITCGFYFYWGVVRMRKYIVRNTDFEDQSDL